METYNEFVDSLTGADPVEDAHLVHEWAAAEGVVWGAGSLVIMLNNLLIQIVDPYYVHDRYDGDLELTEDGLAKLYTQAPKHKPYLAEGIAAWVLAKTHFGNGTTVNTENRGSKARGAEVDKNYVRDFSLELMVPTEDLKKAMMAGYTFHEMTTRFFEVPIEVLGAALLRDGLL